MKTSPLTETAQWPVLRYPFNPRTKMQCEENSPKYQESIASLIGQIKDECNQSRAAFVVAYVIRRVTSYRAPTMRCTFTVIKQGVKKAKQIAYIAVRVVY